MKKYKTYNLILNSFTDSVHISSPIFSKVVDIDIIDNTISAIVEIDTEFEYVGKNKNFYLILKKELEFEFIPPFGYEYFKTCFIEVPFLNTTTSSHGNNSNINLTLSNSKEIYRIFISEIKSIEENRDLKIENLLEE
jgi:hypothetical protein